MSANINKDLLIKHRFWIILGVGILLLLIAIMMLPASVGERVDAKTKEFNSSLSTLQGVKNPKNEDWVKKLKKQDSYVESKKNVVWEQAWKTQGDEFMSWPPDLQEKFSKLYPYFGLPIDPIDREDFSHQYDVQISDVVSLVQPLTPLGAGVVQFNGGWNAVLGLEHQFAHPPSNDDIWFAQEDLWVKRELLRIIRNTNDMVARFQEVVPEPAAGADKKAAKPPPAPPTPPVPGAAKPEEQKATPAQPAKPAATIVAEMPTDLFHKKYRNPFWEIDVTLLQSDKGTYSLKGNIKNIGKHKQPLGIVFKVYLDDLNAEDENTPYGLLAIDRLPLAVGESAEIKEQPLDSSKLIRGIYGVEQILTWKTGPVKRIDALALGYPSSRTANRTLKSAKWVAAARKSELDAQNQQSGGDSGGPPGGMNLGLKMAGRMGLGGQGLSGSATASAGVNLERYTDVNDQVRHMPVGMAVVMEESLIPDFIGTVTNSKLRIQVLQCHFDHIRDRIKPNVEEPSESGDNKSASAQTSPYRQYNIALPDFHGRMQGPGGVPGMMKGVGRRQQDDGGGMLSAMRRQVGSGKLMNTGLAGLKNMGGQGGLTGPGMPGGIGKGLFGGGGGFGNVLAGPNADEEEEEEMNLVEVAIYGLASLYERYPPRPATPPTEDANAAK